MNADPSRRAAFRDELRAEYEARFPRSYAAFQSRENSALLDQTSQAVRWNEPFMLTARRAQGAWFEDLDGHRFIDYFQGHFANILGHNPAQIREILAASIEDGQGLQSGLLYELEAEVADLLARQTSTESVRLTMSGSLGTFYSVLLARAFTGRSKILKINGGWHGSQPFALKGVWSSDGIAYDHLESEGLPRTSDDDILLTRFNDVDGLRQMFAQQGDQLSCFLIEPWLGAGGGIPATKEYMLEARRLTEKHGVLLICDEIITAFRIRAGDASHLYGVRPDLIVMGKVIGGGMPLAAVAGRKDVLSLCTREAKRVKFEGGTYAAQELSLRASKAMLEHLIQNQDSIYPRLAEAGAQMRQRLAQVFDSFGLPAEISGDSAELGGSSLVMVHFSRGNLPAPSCADDFSRQDRKHPWIDESLLKSALLLEGVAIRHGLGTISTAHTEADFQTTVDAFTAVCDRFRRAGLIAV